MTAPIYDQTVADLGGDPLDPPRLPLEPRLRLVIDPRMSEFHRPILNPKDAAEVSKMIDRAGDKIIEPMRVHGYVTLDRKDIEENPADAIAVVQAEQERAAKEAAKKAAAALRKEHDDAVAKEMKKPPAAKKKTAKKATPPVKKRQG